MGPEPELDIVVVLRDFAEREIPFVLIGRQAVRLYGSDCFTRDFDLWLRPACRTEVLTYFKERGLELSSLAAEARPIVHVYGAPMQKLDLIFVRAIRTFDGHDVVLDDVLRRARVQRDPATGLEVSIPDLDDLIALKRVRPGNRKDEEDVRFLQARQAAERSGEMPDGSSR